MNKKKLKEKLENVPKNKYIYQRNNGEIIKYIEIESYYIDCETGFAYDKNDTGFLSKIKENPIDLIEVGDILKIKEDDDIVYLGMGKDMTTISYDDIKEGR